MGILRNLIGTDHVAKAAYNTAPPPSSKPKSRELSPRDYLLAMNPESLGDEHPGAQGMHYGLLMAMSRVPIVANIHQTRINQVIDFAIRTDDPHSNGWQLRMRDKRKSPTTKALASMDQLADVITRAGRDFQPVSGGFENFLGAIVRDSLTYDQVNFEVLHASHIRNTAGNRLPVGFVYVDPSTIRRAKPKASEIKAGRLDAKGSTYVQIIEDKVVNEYDRRKMCFGIRRPRSWVNARGYGFPELEVLVGVVANLLKADTWNSKKFTTGIRADQMITIASDMSAEMFEAVRRIVWAMMAGTNNNQRVPLLQLSPDLKEELKIHNLGQSATDMQFREWINFLIKTACGLYQMDPSEINFTFGNEGQTNAMQNQGPAEQIAASKERGLHPLLRAIAGWINEMVVWQWDPDYEFVFTGYDDITHAERQELDIAAIKSFRTPNEVRAKRDEEPLVLMAGKTNLFDLPQEATIINAAVQLAQQEAAGAGDEWGGELDEGQGQEPETQETEQAGGGEPPGVEEEGETQKGGRIHYGNVQGVDDLVSMVASQYEKRTTSLQAELRRGL